MGAWREGYWWSWTWVQQQSTALTLPPDRRRSSFHVSRHPLDVWLDRIHELTICCLSSSPSPGRPFAALAPLSQQRPLTSSRPASFLGPESSPVHAFRPLVLPVSLLLSSVRRLASSPLAIDVSQRAAQVEVGLARPLCRQELVRSNARQVKRVKREEKGKSTCRCDRQARSVQLLGWQ